jgi:glutaredoxin
MLVEVLTFEGCPHATAALMLVQHVAAATHRTVELRLVNLEEGETVERRFLGSPSIRVDGRDIEPASDARRNYAFSCRLYATPSGLRPLPPEAWVRDALDTAESSISA